MTRQIEFDEPARTELSRLDPPIARRIIAFLRDRVAPLDDPRSLGQALKGERFGEFWKYRVGGHRVIARIDGGRLRILVVRIGHRGKVHG